MHSVPSTGPLDGFADRLIAECGDAIIVADPDGRILSWNRGAESIFGYPQDEAIGKSLDLIIPERLRSRHRDGYRKVMRTGNTRYADDLLAVPGLHRDGSQVSLEFRVTLLRDSSGQPEAIAAFIRDVTERWKAERKLHNDLTRLRALQNPSDLNESVS